jgi:hypothetical protein
MKELLLEFEDSILLLCAFVSLLFTTDRTAIVSYQSAVDAIVMPYVFTFRKFHHISIDWIQIYETNDTLFFLN